MNARREYTPPLRFHFLTRAYDWVISKALPEELFREALIRQADLRPGHRVLDFGCGTATLTLLAERLQPDAAVTGVDVDRRALEAGLAKAAAGCSKVRLHLVSKGPLPFPDCTFDRVVSCLVFHHLIPGEKQLALKECRRILRPGGELRIADWGRPASVRLRLGFLLTQLLDGFETTAAHASGHLPDFIRDAGLSDVSETGHFATAFGSLRLYRAVRRDRNVSGSVDHCRNLST